MLLRFLRRRSGLPMLFHFTHAEAGSGWLSSVLRRIYGEDWVGSDTFAEVPVKNAHLYPAMMLTKEEFAVRQEFSGAKRFAAIRDPRDVVVSLYLNGSARASKEDAESGLIAVIENELPRVLDIQRSWLTSGEVVVRYEDLLAEDAKAIESLLIDRLELPASRGQIRAAVEACRVEKPTTPEQAVWQSHFTKRVAEAFIAKAGDLLVSAGYEEDFSWAKKLDATPPPPRCYRTPVLLRSKGQDEDFTLIHLTHAKAGSSWIYRILRELFPERIAPRGRKVAEATGGDLSRHVFEPQRVYAAMFMRADEFDSHQELAKALRFVVIRDLRDTLVSLYFSVKVSHPLDAEGKRLQERATLESLSTEEGLLHMMETQLKGAAELQRSWLDRNELLYRYEDLLPRDYTLLRELFLERFRLPITQKALRTSLGKYSFEAQYGRRLGEEDASSHGRQGAPGNWRKHFTRRVAETFAEQFGRILVDTGYEHDLDWVKLTQ